MSKTNNYREELVELLDDSVRDEDIDKSIEDLNAVKKQVVLNRILNRIAKENTANELG